MAKAGWILILFTATSVCVLADDSLRFLVLGDWGGSPFYPYDTPWQTIVAREMADVTERYNSSFNLALGDNFYRKGVRNVNDKRFLYTFENVYHYKSLMNPWYLLAGNHDHHGNVTAQIEYSKRSHRWNFPDFYYKLSFDVPGGKTMEILMLDTVLLCGNTADDDDRAPPNGPDDETVAEEQWTWLEKELKSSRADYLFAAGHFPVYSAGIHGSTECLIKRLQPLLYKYNVTAYLCGHDHSMQHLQVTKDHQTMDYIVSGAGVLPNGIPFNKFSVPTDSLKYFWGKWDGEGGFAYFDVTVYNATVQFISGKSQTLYQTVLFPRK